MLKKVLSSLEVTSTTHARLQDLILSTINMPTRWGDFRVSKNLSYGEKSRHCLDIYTPKLASSPCPVIVFFYGGRWKTGSKADYPFVANALTSLGYIVVIPDYRLYPEVVFPEFVEDAANAVAWVHHNIQDYGGHPKQLFLMGFSAGAHIATLLALDEKYLQASREPSIRVLGMIGLAGVYDFNPATATDLDAIFGPASRYPLSQPNHFVNDNMPPFLLLHGKKDTIVKYKNTTKFATTLQTHDGLVSTIYYEKLNHTLLLGTFSGFLSFLAPVLKDVHAFIQECLLLEKPNPLL